MATSECFLIFDIATDKYLLYRQGWVSVRTCATYWETRAAAEKRLVEVRGYGGVRNAVILPV